MANYAQQNPGFYHVGHRFPSPVRPFKLPDVVEELLTVRFKTAVVTNRTVYIGNVKKTNLKGETTIEGDTMYKSAVGKFDTFADFRKIEASIADGDAIIKLEEYADRILQFKKHKMHLINVSQEIEFLEDTLLYKGVSHPAATCKTDFGIAWVNKLGCYLYDGKEVHNLLEKQGRQIIKESNWDDFITDNSIIGYVPKKRQLIVLKDCTASSAGNIYLYDLVTQSWTKGDTKFTDSQIQTNFINDWNGDLVHTHTSGTGTVMKWSDTGVYSLATTMATKDIDFGQPGQRKKVYKIYVTYKGGSIGALPEITKVVCLPDVSDSLNEKYFTVFFRNDAAGGGTAGQTTIWFDTDNSGSSKPSVSGEDDDIEVTGVKTNDAAEVVALHLAAAIDNHTNGDGNPVATCKVQGDTVFITDVVSDFRTAASDGDTGFNVSTHFDGNSGGTGNAIDVMYSVDGSSSFLQFDANLTDTTGNWIQAELTPSASINNIKSIRLKFSSVAASTFEINDISIVYRLKPVR
jgi:hypothetical protein